MSMVVSLTPASGSGPASSSSEGTSVQDGGGDGGSVPHLLGPHPGLHPLTGVWSPQLRPLQGDSLCIMTDKLCSSIID